MKNDLTRSTTHGVMWVSVSQLVMTGTQFVVTAVLARLLVPEEFGIVAAVTIFTGLIVLVNELGLGAAIIQRKELNESHLSTTFWASLAAGISFWLLATIASPFVAAFYHEDLVRPVLIVSSAAFVVGTFGVVHRSLLARNLDFKKLAVSEVVGGVVYGLVSVSLAIAHFGVWSLVWGGLSASFASVVILWWIERWQPRIRFSLRSFRELFVFGGYVTAARSINYARQNVDYLIVGRLLGRSHLGVYSLAFRLIMFPMMRLSTLVTRVTFPAFSRIQDENERLRRGYLKLATYTSVLTFPMLAGLLAVAPEFVVVVFGEKWNAAITPIQILCVYGMMMSVGTLVGPIIRAKGRADIELKWNVAQLAMLTTSVLIGVHYELAGVAVAVTLNAAVTIPIIQWIVGSLIGLRLRDYLRSLYPATFGSAVMLACVAGYRQLALDLLHLNNLPLLVSSVVLGVIAYLLAMRMIKPELLLELKELAVMAMKPHPTADVVATNSKRG
ncbi:MOP flippase family protein [Chloroflexota bacterium]